jgi:hypothetical protein
MAETERINWIDEETQTPVIEKYARQLNSFVETFADGRVDESELAIQEGRVVALLKEIEPQLDDALHRMVTELLCELSSYDIMRFFFTMQKTRPKTTFRG